MLLEPVLEAHFTTHHPRGRILRAGLLDVSVRFRSNTVHEPRVGRNGLLDQSPTNFARLGTKDLNTEEGQPGNERPHRWPGLRRPDSLAAL